MLWKNFWTILCNHKVWNPSPNPTTAMEISHYCSMHQSQTYGQWWCRDWRNALIVFVSITSLPLRSITQFVTRLHVLCSQCSAHFNLDFFSEGHQVLQLSSIPHRTNLWPWKEVPARLQKYWKTWSRAPGSWSHPLSSLGVPENWPETTMQ